MIQSQPLPLTLMSLHMINHTLAGCHTRYANRIGTNLGDLEAVIELVLIEYYMTNTSMSTFPSMYEPFDQIGLP